MRAFLLLPLLFHGAPAVGPGVAGADGGPDAGAAAARPALLERVCVVGASVSDGFGLSADLGVRLQFGDVLAAALAGVDEVDTFASTWFFRDPLGTGREQQERALEREPTLLVAVDYLFWFGYGYQPEDQRAARLERGLELLDAFACPILVGDFPDMSRAALEGTSPLGMPLIAPGQVPAEETLVALNERVAAWAAERERVHVVPLARFVAALDAGQALDVRGNEVPAGEAGALLQEDLLHPTLDGALLLAAIALDPLAKSGGLGADGVVWERAAMRARLEELHAEELERVRERERRREERRRAREERRGETGGDAEGTDGADDASSGTARIDVGARRAAARVPAPCATGSDA